MFAKFFVTHVIGHGCALAHIPSLPLDLIPELQLQELDWAEQAWVG